MTPHRHDQLIAAGWRYDGKSNRYAAPGSAMDGTERYYNLDAAWQAQQMNEAAEAEATQAKPAPKGTRVKDPREQEPQ